MSIYFKTLLTPCVIFKIKNHPPLSCIFIQCRKTSGIINSVVAIQYTRYDVINIRHVVHKLLSLQDIITLGGIGNTEEEKGHALRTRVQRPTRETVCLGFNT